MKHFFTTLSAIALATSMSACAEAGPKSASNLDRSDIENIVKEYLLENPEIIREALIELENRNDAEDMSAAMKVVSSQIYNDPRDVVIGPKDAKVTVVEFFDYNCGYCKRSTSWVEGIIKDHPNDVRVIFKELPVLDRGRQGTSREAAKAALAAARQGKYLEVHVALMNERSLSESRIRNIVEKAGLDMDKFDADRKDVALEQHIDDTYKLSNRIPALTGTPFFFVNDDYVSGANVPKLETLVSSALKG
ncbi:protein-disulfide isomerase [Litorimonas taeanensis]|uniref:Protein-disulfide isomerase n=1 Tax=Litorimonas taeanensis TaxID=568099 RepID=A0A420WJY5_9PROT|nr:DsbA family protein [Litorimonas taeanensis]RKQ71259.1 protein-disulfide isomerase [Litorimonas taeanensis]